MPTVYKYLIKLNVLGPSISGGGGAFIWLILLRLQYNHIFYKLLKAFPPKHISRICQPSGLFFSLYKCVDLNYRAWTVYLVFRFVFDYAKHKIYKYIDLKKWHKHFFHREVWPDREEFGREDISPEEEFMALREVFFANLPSKSIYELFWAYLFNHI